MRKQILVLLLLSVGATFSLMALPVDTGQTTSFNADSATQFYLNTLSEAARAKSDAYFEGGYWLQLWNFVYAFAVAFIFLRLGLSKWLKQKLSRVKSLPLQNLFYMACYLLLVWLLTFPFSVYQDYFREHQYGLSNLSFGGWMMENIKGLVIGIVLGAPLLMLLYIALRKTGKNWWLWGASGTILFMGLMMFIAPVFLMPIFNKYEPLQDGPLKQEILSMARANSIPAENVYRFDASKQSKRVSANVSGLGSTTRISLNDNLLNRCTPAEIKAVMGHEMGHYVLNHIYKGMIEFGVLIFIVFAFVNWAFNKLLIARGRQWGIESLSDIVGFPLLVFLMALAMFVATPITNTITRTAEMEADIFGLNAAREPDGEAKVDMMLSEYRKVDPGYWEEILFFDHPSGRVRVATAMRWKAEHLNDAK